MRESKYVTIMLIPDGTEARWGFRIRQWLLKAIIVVIGLIIVGLIVFFFLFGEVLSRAAMVDEVMKENEALMRYRYKVGILERNLVETREIVTRLVKMAGIDFEFPELPDDSVLFAGLGDSMKMVVGDLSSHDWSMPEGMPIQGFITQNFQIDDQEHYHPGVDIACALGTPVLATASGVVEYADYDSTYGYMVVLRHNDSVVTLYGHNQQLLVATGQDVFVGGRIALSGSTGQSSAPHLHYEIRVNGEPLNPMEYPYEENQQQ